MDEDPKVTDVYKKDFFQHLFHDMVAARSGMFLYNDSNTLAWFPTTVRLYILIEEYLNYRLKI